jgi:MFS family permease
MLSLERRAPSLQLAEKKQLEGKPDGSKKGKWHALAATWLGEAFDAMDASLYFVALVPAMTELLRSNNDTVIGQTGSIVLAVFMMGWFFGALIFGGLADRIGRRKTMLITILLYSLATGLCALCQNWMQLAACRFVVGCGIGGEICLGTVVIAEFWKGRGRLWATCVLESSFNAGLLFASGLNVLIGVYGWRWLFIAGVIPALATVYIRSKLKESESFEEVAKHRVETVSATSEKPKSSWAQLMERDMRGKLFWTASFAMSAIVGYWACVAWLPAWVNQLTGDIAIGERSTATTLFSIGGLVGCFLTPLILDRLGRKNTVKLSFVGGLIAAVTMFVTIKTFGLPLLLWAFALGVFTNVQFTTLQIYIPEVFPTSMLATAAGVCYGAGRVFSACLALCGGQLIAFYGGSYALASATLSLVYIVGVIAAFFIMETDGAVAGTRNLRKAGTLVPQPVAATSR